MKNGPGMSPLKHFELREELFDLEIEVSFVDRLYFLPLPNPTRQFASCARL